jgi:hypothetical protein
MNGFQVFSQSPAQSNCSNNKFHSKLKKNNWYQKHNFCNFSKKNGTWTMDFSRLLNLKNTKSRLTFLCSIYWQIRTKRPLYWNRDWMKKRTKSISRHSNKFTKPKTNKFEKCLKIGLPFPEIIYNTCVWIKWATLIENCRRKLMEKDQKDWYQFGQTQTSK